jgi:hypothetical protein
MPVTEPQNASMRVRPRSVKALVREAVIIVSVYLIYDAIRNLAPDRAELANQHGWNGLTVERHLHIDIEHTLNDFVSSHPALAVACNYFYATLFLASVVAVLGWLWVRRPQVYSHYRTILVVMTLIALVCFWLYPLAPPRLLPGGGFVDTVPYFHTWGMDPSKPARGAGVSNQFAAMPSMHFGWALWCGVTLWRCASHVWHRVVGVLYPAMTAFVVLGTANHYVLDILGGALAFMLAMSLVTWRERHFVRATVPQALRG